LLLLCVIILSYFSCAKPVFSKFFPIIAVNMCVLCLLYLPNAAADGPPAQGGPV